jgi:beta-lactamase regulating signal transducer with metallopeptidase domain
MIASWMLYIAAVSAVVTLAAAMLESGLRAVRLPARLVWVIGMCIVLFAAIRSAPVRQPPTPDRGSISTSRSIAKIQVGSEALQRQSQFWSSRPSTFVISQDSPARRLDPALLAIWLSASLLALGLFGRAAMRLRLVRRRADVSSIGSVPVLITRDTGPLVIGVFHPEIVLPQWVLALNTADRQLVVAHEQEHCRAADPALLAFGVIAAAIAPWSPVSWYMLRRLRAAVELDCDQRVLGAHPNRRAYAALLLSVAGRSNNTLMPVAGLATSVSSLEQRFRLMSMNPSRFRAYRMVSSVAVAMILVTTTAMLPRPVRGTASGLIEETQVTQTQSRATGRIRVDGASGFVGYRVYATGGKVAEAGHPLRRLRAVGDTLFGIPGDVFDVDVTDGEVHFVAERAGLLHVEAAMSGSSPAIWMSATGEHIVIARGGYGIGGPRSSVIR